MDKQTPDALASLPLDYGMRAAAAFLGCSHAVLSRASREPGAVFAPDRARMAGGNLYPSWSAYRLVQIKRTMGAK